ncbi:hypothetical protein [Aquimarina longa]|uniref:hypothetical protein n=1 Tax=Aquimarina longa TaxID=1080221 RepID=UPI000A3E2614|nr:hypothetical protein [Aquimarina longa]
MRHIASTSYLNTIIAPYSFNRSKEPRRKSLALQSPNFGFVKAVKQDFVRNPRMMSGTRCMVLMLLGWAGSEQPIKTTAGIIAKKLGRSVRQVHRYLQDAIQEGYLYYSRTKDRLGYYTGIKIHLNFGAIRSYKKQPVPRTNSDMTDTADTNTNFIYKREDTKQEREYLSKIDAILKRNGLPPTP